MDYVQLGRSGLRVSPICLGTLTFGREASVEDSYRIMDYFVEKGFNFLDTANAYTTGRSEEILGAWMAERRNRSLVVIATKVYNSMGPGPNDSGISRAHILDAVDESLRRLQTDHIDLYQIHRWDPTVPPEETLEALDDIVSAGKVRYIGCSNLKAWHLARFLRISDERIQRRFVSIQPVYNALNRGIELEVLPLCEREGLGVISYNPLAGGMLTGKYRRGAKLPEGARLDAYDSYHQRYYTDHAFDIVERFVTHAKELSITPAQLALAWCLAEPRVTAPVLGARTVEQITDSLACVNVKLSPEDREQVPTVLPGRWVGTDPVYDRRD
jgi:aryl-alcohol dehydrogenase-like predicted oxidoreductase